MLCSICGVACLGFLLRKIWGNDPLSLNTNCLPQMFWNKCLRLHENINMAATSRLYRSRPAFAAELLMYYNTSKMSQSDFKEIKPCDYLLDIFPSWKKRPNGDSVTFSCRWKRALRQRKGNSTDKSKCSHRALYCSTSIKQLRPT